MNTDLWGLIPLTLLTSLATYRAWRVIGKDTISEPLRAYLVPREDRASRFVLGLIECCWCLGFWIAGALAAGAVVVFGLGLFEGLLLWLSTSALAGLVANHDE